MRRTPSGPSNLRNCISGSTCRPSASPSRMKVRVLPDDIANRIAAGEVVDRPASIVKELMENSLDAGATRIAVDVLEGGRRLIRVTDNGIGMEADDAQTCLLRHATSKLYN